MDPAVYIPQAAILLSPPIRHTQLTFTRPLSTFVLLLLAHTRQLLPTVTPDHVRHNVLH